MTHTTNTDRDEPGSALALVRETLLPNPTARDKRLLAIAFGSGMFAVSSALAGALILGSGSPTENLHTVASHGQITVPSTAAVGVPQGPMPRSDFEELAGGKHRFAVEVQGHTYVLLDEIDGELAQGLRLLSPRPAHADAAFSVVAGITTDAIPPPSAAWNGRDVVVNGTCSAHVVGIYAVSRLVGDFWVTGDTSPEKDTHGIWENGTRHFAARLSECPAGYARDAHLEPAVRYEQLEISPKLYGSPAFAEARRKLRYSRAYTVVERRFHNDKSNMPSVHWDHDRGDDLEESVQLFYSPNTKKGFLTINRTVSGECGEFDGHVGGVFPVELQFDEHGSSPILKLNGPESSFTINSKTTWGAPTGFTHAVDSDGDGVPEFTAAIFMASIRIDSEGSIINSVETAFHGCPC